MFGRHSVNGLLASKLMVALLDVVWRRQEIIDLTKERQLPFTQFRQLYIDDVNTVTL